MRQPGFGPLFAVSTILLVMIGLLDLPVAASPGPVSLSIRPVSPTVSEIIAHQVGTAPGARPGASWDIYFNFDHSLGQLAKVTAGPDWDAMACGFIVNVSDGQPSSVLSANDVVINGVCTTRIPEGVVKEEVVVATLTWTDCRRGFVVDLRTGVEEFGGPVTDLIDIDNQAYRLTDADLYDGGACGDTTVGLQTKLENPVAQPSPLLTSAPLLAAVIGTALVVIVAVVVLVRRRAH